MFLWNYVVSVGAITSISVACGSTTANGEGDEAEIVTYDFTAFKEDIIKNIVFEEDSGSGHVVDNATLDTEIPNVTLKYGWMETEGVQPSGTIADHKKIQDLTNGYFFTIDMEAINGATFEGETPATIYIEINGLVNPEGTILSTDVQKVVNIAQKMTFEGDNGSGHVAGEYGVLDKGILNVRLKYGWAETEGGQPFWLTPKYNQLQDLTNGYFFTIDMEAANGSTFEGEAPTTIYVEISGLIDPAVVIPNTDVKTFVNAAKNLTFEGDNGSGHVVDNATLNTGIPNVTLKYGWAETKDAQPDGTVLDYSELQDLTNGNFFTIDMETANGATFEGEAPTTIYKKISGLTDIQLSEDVVTGDAGIYISDLDLDLNNDELAHALSVEMTKDVPVDSEHYKYEFPAKLVWHGDPEAQTPYDFASPVIGEIESGQTQEESIAASLLANNVADLDIIRGLVSSTSEENKVASVDIVLGDTYMETPITSGSELSQVPNAIAHHLSNYISQQFGQVYESLQMFDLNVSFNGESFRIYKCYLLGSLSDVEEVVKKAMDENQDMLVMFQAYIDSL